MRAQNPFTDRQLRLLETIRHRLRAMNDPDPEVITNEEFSWGMELTSEFGRIPKLKFHTQATRIKAELIQKACPMAEAKEKELAKIRAKYDVQGAKYKEASRFESEFNNLMIKAKKAMATVAMINQMFATEGQVVSDPIKLLQEIVNIEYGSLVKSPKEPIHTPRDHAPAETRENKGIEPYDVQLERME